jgi:hypothetical protein
MPRRKEQVRFGWKKLTPAYRKRLERKGITQRTWEDGADLRAARGKPAAGLKTGTKSQRTLTQKAVRADATPAELRALEGIITRPRWIPADLQPRTEVAAVLATLPDPKTWKHVYITPAPDGQPWTLTIYRKRSKYPLIVEIPGGGGAEGEAPREVIDVMERLVKDYKSPDKISTDEIFYSVMGTDVKAPRK